MPCVDVLYIKGVKSPNNDDELRYSLRSLRKVKDLGRVFITGEKPDFVKNVIHTPAKDIGCRMINHWWKVYQTIINTDISDNFVLMYDDIFFVKDICLSEYPFYNRGFLGDNCSGTPLYRKNLEEAKNWLIRHNFSIYDFEIHIPCIYNKKDFLKLTDIYKEYKNKEIAPAVRSMYGNINKVYSPYRKDLKLVKKGDNLELNECFCTTDSSFVYALDYLKEKFNTESPYENSVLS